MSNVSSATNYFPTVNEGFITTVAAPGISSGGGTVPLTSVSGLTNGTTFVGIVEPGLTNQQAFTGIVDTAGAQITGVVWTRGSNTAHATGKTIVDYVTGTAINLITTGIRKEHNSNGTHAAVTATSVTASAAVQGATVVATGDIQHRSTSLETIRSETTFDFVVVNTGVWSGDALGSTRLASMTAATVYLGGRRFAVSAVTSRTFTASRDTYVDVSSAGALVYTEVANNAASPALASGSVRLAIIVTGATNIADAGSINQGEETKVLPIVSSIAYTVTDSLGNLICPRDPSRKLLSYRRTATAATVASTSWMAIAGLSCPVVVPAGRKVRVRAFCFTVSDTVASYVFFGVFDGSISDANRITSTAHKLDVAGNSQAEQYVEDTTTPTSTNKTYLVGAKVGGGTGSFGAQATGTGTEGGPMWIKVELE